VHAALCWLLHPEGEIVSPGIDIAGYLAGGNDAAVPAQRTEPQELVRLDRHTVLKLYAASLSTTALGTGLHSCASGLHQSA
jgi:hypothetical protein